MKKKSKVSFVMPVFNKEHYIAESIESVINQKYPNKELIIVDDRSFDSTSEVCKYYTDNYDFIKYCRNDFNVGVGTCRNIGWNMAKGDYILVQDPDDLSPEYRADKTVEFFDKNEDIDILYGSCGLIDSFGIYRNAINAIAFEINRIKNENYIQHPTVAYRRKIKARYRPVRFIDDWFFYMDCVENDLKFGHIQDIMAYYRPLSDGLTLKDGYKNAQKNTLKAQLIEEFKSYDDDLSFKVKSDELQQVRFSDILKLIKPKSDVLDIGCNGGYFMELLKHKKDCNVIGIEIASNLLKICKNKKLEVYGIDIKNEYLANKFDYIILGDILEHYNEQDIYRILINAFKMLKDEHSRLIITIPAEYGKYSVKFIEEHVKNYNLQDFEKIFNKFVDHDIIVKEQGIFCSNVSYPMWTLLEVQPCQKALK
jgi:glycosyltransferase involved in cell wall biosynthesis